MPLIRATFFFKDQNNAGWSETYYNNASDLTQGLDKAQNGLLPLRVALLGSGSGLYYIRVSDDLVKRDSQVFIVPPGSTTPARGSESNYASDDVVVRIEGIGSPVPFTVRRTLALRGAPVAITGQAGTFTGSPSWNNAFKAFVGELLADGWAIKYRTRTNLPSVITALTQVLPSGITSITTAAPLGLNPGDGIKIVGCAGATGANGLWRVLTCVGNVTTIEVPRILGVYVGLGQASKNDYALATMSKVLIVRTSTHKAGRPFDVLHGRRRVVRAT